MIMGKKKMRMKPNPFSDQSSTSIHKPHPPPPSSSPSSSSTATTWPWPPYYYYCHQQPRTLSFRTTTSADSKPISAATVMAKPNDSIAGPAATEPNVGPGPRNPDSSFDDDPAAVETVIRGLKQSDRRLFFSPGETSSSILQEPSSTSTAGGLREEGDRSDDGEGGDLLYPFKDGGAGAVALTLDSQDPFEDFKKSMAEMVEAHGLRDWESLEQLLGCYLKVNGKSNHGYIVGAFVDLLVGLSVVAPKTTSAEEEEGEYSNCSCSSNRHQGDRRQHYSPSSPLSFYTSFSSSSSSEDSSSTPCVSSLEAYREAAEGDELEIDDEISTAASLAVRRKVEGKMGRIN